MKANLISEEWGKGVIQFSFLYVISRQIFCPIHRHIFPSLPLAVDVPAEALLVLLHSSGLCLCKQSHRHYVPSVLLSS